MYYTFKSQPQITKECLSRMGHLNLIAGFEVDAVFIFTGLDGETAPAVFMF